MAVGEWDQRQLCSDGGCVGVIGPDGTCKVCGRAAPNWGDERKRGLIDPPEGPEGDDDDETEGDDLAASEAASDRGDDDEDEDDEDDDGENDEEDDDREDGVAASLSPSEWSARRLCPDGACIGLIGLDGKCKVCGRAASRSEPTAAPDPDEAIAAAPASGDPPGAASEAANAEPVTPEPVPPEPAPEPVTAEPANAKQDKVVP